MNDQEFHQKNRAAIKALADKGEGLARNFVRKIFVEALSDEVLPPFPMRDMLQDEINTLRDALAANDPNGWIAAADLLPEHGQEVFVWVTGRTDTNGNEYDVYPHIEWLDINHEDYDFPLFECAEDGFVEPGQWTHWKPLNLTPPVGVSLTRPEPATDTRR